MRKRLTGLVGLVLVAFVPTISIFFTMNFNDDELISQAIFICFKLWLLIIPAYWFIHIEGNELSWSLPDYDGLKLGGTTGIMMAMIIIGMWIIFDDTIDTDAMIAEMKKNGLTDIRLYLAGMFYWIFFNSMLEEYVFRWFVTMKGVEIFGSESKAIALSAALFTLHHTIALHFFGFLWWQTIIASIGLLSAAAIWSWLYIRHRSIWVCWLSHSICDVVVFGIGYIIIFG